MDVRLAQELMGARNIDALVVSSPENVLYTTGLNITHTVSNRSVWLDVINAPIVPVIPRDGEPWIVIPESAIEICQEFSLIKDIRPYKGGIYKIWPPELKVRTYELEPIEVVAKVLEEKGITSGNIGIETETVVHQHYEKLAKRLPQVTLVSGTPILNELRSVKSPDEINRLRKAAQITERAMAAAADIIRPGATELDLIREWKMSVVKDGGDWQHATIAAGPVHSAATTAIHTSYALKKGDVVRMDTGAVWNGYSSDITRCYAVGAASKEFKDLYVVLLEAEAAMLELVRPGTVISDIYSTGEQIVRKAGYPEYRRRNLGHSIGIRVVEEPIIGPTSSSELKPNMVVAVEVPIYFAGKVGLSVEDIVLVTEDGKELFSKLPREIMVAG